MEIIVRHCVLNHPFRNVSDIPEDLDWHFDGEKCPEGFLINSDLGDFNSEHGALFAQAALIAFDRNELIEFKIAFTCSNLKRPDGFGGAACVVSKDFIRWTGLHNFLEAERTAFAEKMNYFFVNLQRSSVSLNIQYRLYCVARTALMQRIGMMRFSLNIAMVGKKMPKEGYNLVLALPSKIQYETNHS